MKVRKLFNPTLSSESRRLAGKQELHRELRRMIAEARRRRPAQLTAMEFAKLAWPQRPGSVSG